MWTNTFFLYSIKMMESLIYLVANLFQLYWYAPNSILNSIIFTNIFPFDKPFRIFSPKEQKLNFLIAQTTSGHFSAKKPTANSLTWIQQYLTFRRAITTSRVTVVTDVDFIVHIGDYYWYEDFCFGYTYGILRVSKV